MKQLLLLAFTCAAMIVVACSSTKTSAQNSSIVDQYGKKEQLTDTFLRRLQRENDLVLASAVEQTAWGRSVAYKIVARKNGTWKGYSYNITRLKEQQAQVTEVAISNQACDAVIQYFNEPAVWKAKSDTEAIACNVAIDDGSTWHLLMITPAKLLRATYYEPAFYQEHCPDADRKAFLDASEKIKVLFDKSSSN